MVANSMPCFLRCWLASIASLYILTTEGFWLDSACFVARQTDSVNCIPPEKLSRIRAHIESRQ